MKLYQSRQEMYLEIKKLYNMSLELGGDVYTAAESGGLLSAVRFMNSHFGEEYTLSNKVKIVIEAYVKFAETEEPDRIFLYLEEELPDESLLKEGCVENGRFILPYDKLQNLAERGYKCLYQKAEDEHNGRKLVRYYNAFGENQAMVPLKMWDNVVTYEGNGINYAFYVRTKYETLFVMPDLYKVQQAIDQSTEAGITQHINTAVRVGICFSDIEAYGICFMPDGTVGKILNKDYTYEKPENSPYSFGWHRVITEETNLADSSFAMTEELEAIVESTEKYYGAKVEKIYITFKYEFPGRTKLIHMLEHSNAEWNTEYVDYATAVMKVYGKQQKLSDIKENDTMLLYDFDEFVLSLDLIKRDGTDFRMICRHEVDLPEDFLYEEGEDFSEVYRNTFQDIYEDEFGEPDMPGLRQVIWSDIDHFMLDEGGLDAFGVQRYHEADCQAFEAIRSRYSRIKRQLMHNDSAKIEFDNGYLQVTADYPIDRLANCFSRVLRNNQRAVGELLQKAGLTMDDISGVILLGEESQYPFVKTHLEKATGKPVYRIV